MVHIKRQILVIENDLKVCQAIYDSMQNDLTDVCYMTSAIKALASYMTQDYCLVILDVHLSDVSGIELLRTIRKAKHMPILVLTDFVNTDDKLTLFEAGADACVEGTPNIAVCVAQANALINLYVGAGIHDGPHNLIAFGSELIISPRYRQVIIDGTPLELTKKEFDIFYYLATYPGQVFTREQLYDCAWNDVPAVAVDEAVKAQIKSLRRKLALMGKDYIHTERGIGYKFILFS